MRLLTAVSLVRAQQGEPKKSRLPFGSLLFLSFVLFAQANCPCAQRPSAVNWRSRCRCRWQKKAARAHGRHPCFTRAIVPMENTLVPTRSVVHARQAKKSRAPQASSVHSLDFYRTSGVLTTVVSLVRQKTCRQNAIDNQMNA